MKRKMLEECTGNERFKNRELRKGAKINREGDQNNGTQEPPSGEEYTGMEETTTARQRREKGKAQQQQIHDGKNRYDRTGFFSDSTVLLAQHFNKFRTPEDDAILHSMGHNYMDFGIKTAMKNLVLWLHNGREVERLRDTQYKIQAQMDKDFNDVFQAYKKEHEKRVQAEARADSYATMAQKCQADADLARKAMEGNKESMMRLYAKTEELQREISKEITATSVKRE